MHKDTYKWIAVGFALLIIGEYLFTLFSSPHTPTTQQRWHTLTINLNARIADVKPYLFVNTNVTLPNVTVKKDPRGYYIITDHLTQTFITLKKKNITPIVYYDLELPATLSLNNVTFTILQPRIEWQSQFLFNKKEYVAVRVLMAGQNKTLYPYEVVGLAQTTVTKVGVVENVKKKGQRCKYKVNDKEVLNTLNVTFKALSNDTIMTLGEVKVKGLESMGCENVYSVSVFDDTVGNWLSGEVVSDKEIKQGDTLVYTLTLNPNTHTFVNGRVVG